MVACQRIYPLLGGFGRSLGELHCLGLSYHLRARRRLDWITRWRGDSNFARPPFGRLTVTERVTSGRWRRPAADISVSRLRTPFSLL